MRMNTIDSEDIRHRQWSALEWEVRERACGSHTALSFSRCNVSVRYSRSCSSEDAVDGSPAVEECVAGVGRRVGCGSLAVGLADGDDDRLDSGWIDAGGGERDIVCVPWTEQVGMMGRPAGGIDWCSLAVDTLLSC